MDPDEEELRAEEMFFADLESLRTLIADNLVDCLSGQAAATEKFTQERTRFMRDLAQAAERRDALLHQISTLENQIKNE